MHFEFGPVVQEEMPFKSILIWISDSPFVQRSITNGANLVEGIKGNNPVKLF